MLYDGWKLFPQALPGVCPASSPLQFLGISRCWEGVGLNLGFLDSDYSLSLRVPAEKGTKTCLNSANPPGWRGGGRESPNIKNSSGNLGEGTAWRAEFSLDNFFFSFFSWRRSGELQGQPRVRCWTRGIFPSRLILGLQSDFSVAFSQLSRGKGTPGRAVKVSHPGEKNFNQRFKKKKKRGGVGFRD